MDSKNLNFPLSDSSRLQDLRQEVVEIRTQLNRIETLLKLILLKLKAHAQ